MTGSPAEPTTYSVPTSTEELARLLTLLYPDPPSVDILTLEDFKFRYRLSGLGATAVRACESAQRISRLLGDHLQIGLCEFHIGLIHLFTEQHLGANSYFAEARTHWHFLNEQYAPALAEFAQGVARHSAYYYEKAFGHYSKAEALLPEIKWATPSESQDRFVQELRERIRRSKDDLREKMHQNSPEIAAPPPVPPASPNEVPTKPEPTTQPTIVLPEVPAPTAPAVPLPISSLGDSQPSPIPGHEKNSPHYHWYEVSFRFQDQFFPEIHQGAWLLVHTHEPDYKNNDPILYISDTDQQASIHVRPLVESTAVPQPFARIYLAQCRQEGAFVRDSQSGQVTLAPDMQPLSFAAEQILGIVVGFWSKAPFMAYS